MAAIQNDNFDIHAPKHIDARVVVTSTTERDNISTSYRYEGMRVFVTANLTWYELRGGTANANWVSDEIVNFDPNSNYAVGDAVFYLGVLYIANTTITASAWNSSEWDTINDLVSVSGHIIEDEGSAVTQRNTINFTGTGVTVIDSGGKTVVDISGSSNSAGDGININSNVVSLDLENYITDTNISIGTSEEQIEFIASSIYNKGTSYITGQTAGQASLIINPAGSGDLTLIQLRESNGSTAMLSIQGDSADGEVLIQAEDGYNLLIGTAGSDDVKINGLIYPALDGSSGQVLQTDGAGNLSFVTVSSGSGRHSITDNGGAGLTDRPTLNFKGTYWSVTDDAGNTRTDVEITDIDGGVISVQVQRDTAANLAALIPNAGEFMYATDTNKIAVGDGSTAFASLDDLTTGADHGSLTGLNDFGDHDGADIALTGFTGAMVSITDVQSAFDRIDDFDFEVETMEVGVGSLVDFVLTDDVGFGTSNPAIKWNSTLEQWQLKHNTTTYSTLLIEPVSAANEELALFTGDGTLQRAENLYYDISANTFVASDTPPGATSLNSIVTGTGHKYLSTPVSSWSAIFGEDHTMIGTLGNILIAGWKNTVGKAAVAPSGVYGTTFGNKTINEGVAAYVGGLGAKVQYNGSGFSNMGGGFAHGLTENRYITDSGFNPAIEEVLAMDGAINISANTFAQTSGQGALAPLSAIFAGKDHHIPADSDRSVIIGGNAISARATDPDQVYVPNLNIDSTPTSSTISGDSLLLRDGSTGEVYVKAQGAFQRYQLTLTDGASVNINAASFPSTYAELDTTRSSFTFTFTDLPDQAGEVVIVIEKNAEPSCTVTFDDASYEHRNEDNSDWNTTPEQLLSGGIGSLFMFRGQITGFTVSSKPIILWRFYDNFT